MNYSTLRKVFAVSTLALAGISTASAQSTATTSSSTTTVFGGAKQYRTWSLGVNAGTLTTHSLIQRPDISDPDLGNFGVGAFLKKQFTHGFAAKLDFQKSIGTIKGKADEARYGVPAGSEFETELHYALALKGVFNIGSVSFLSRTKNVSFALDGGIGLANYDATPTISGAVPANVRTIDGETNYFIPIGGAINFKLSEGIALNLAYTTNFLDADNFEGVYAGDNNDKWTYASAGLEFTLGSKSKPSLAWTNPVAVMYDELKDPTLRQEVEALKTRVSTLENTVNQLSADADGDGVSDKFDKEPNSAAGAVVDGSGRTIKFPSADSLQSGAGNVIQFEFDSSVLKTSSYPTLDRISSELRANSAAKVTLDGHASAEGTEAYNMNLSRDRANSVKTYLVNSGVDANRITIKAYGETRPIASNATEEGRIKNRRVEIKQR